MADITIKQAAESPHLESSPYGALAVDVRNADRYANQLADIYNASVHTALMKHDPKAAIRIATLFAGLCSTTGRADMRVSRLPALLTQEAKA